MQSNRRQVRILHRRMTALPYTRGIIARPITTPRPVANPHSATNPRPDTPRVPSQIRTLLQSASGYKACAMLQKRRARAFMVRSACDTTWR